MRRLIVIVVLAVLHPGAAAASDVNRGVQDGTIVVTDSRPGDATRARPAPEQAQEWFTYVIVRWVSSDGFCLDTMWTRNEQFARRQNRVSRLAEANGGTMVDCPPDAVDVPDPGTIAAVTWQDVKNLPVPSLDIDPDYALAGKEVYLEIGGGQSCTETVDNPIGDDIVIIATSEYVIDWGDPRHPEPTVTRSQGGPWPDGDVTHVYSDETRARTITVTQRWRATWSAGAQRGTLEQLSTTSAPLTFQVRELEAVRNR